MTGFPLNHDLCWFEDRSRRAWPGQAWREREMGSRPALLLDRDGVVIRDTGYVARPEDVHLLPGAAEAIAEANRRGIATALVTNQSGIARGHFDWAAFSLVQERMHALLLDAAGARLDLMLACPHHAAGRPPHDVADHPWRKPAPGMLLAALGHLGAAPERSLMVGDRQGDLDAATAAGVGQAVLGDGSRFPDAALRVILSWQDGSPPMVEGADPR